MENWLTVALVALSLALLWVASVIGTARPVRAEGRDPLLPALELATILLTVSGAALSLFRLSLSDTSPAYVPSAIVISMAGLAAFTGTAIAALHDVWPTRNKVSTRYTRAVTLAYFASGALLVASTWVDLG